MNISTPSDEDRLADLSREVRAGIEQAEQGRGSPFNEATLEEARSVARKRLRAGEHDGRIAGGTKLRPRMHLEVAANGRTLATRPDGTALWNAWLKAWLRFQGFRRDGVEVVGSDEAIAPDYVRGDLRLNAGWDRWSGFYLMAVDEAGDDFLRSAFGRALTAASPA